MVGGPAECTLKRYTGSNAAAADFSGLSRLEREGTLRCYLVPSVIDGIRVLSIVIPAENSLQSPLLPQTGVPPDSAARFM